MKIFFIIIVCVVTLAVILPVLLDFFIIYVYRWDYRLTKRFEYKKGLLGNYDDLPKKNFKFRSYDGYILNCEYIPAEEKSKKFVIITHGYTYTKYGSVKYLNMFRSMGFNCIIYDNRGHGKNKFSKCTFGLKESQDLICLIDSVKRKFSDDIFLGLHGESMGSGISISALKYKPDIDFVVADCGYGVLSDVLEHKIKQILHLPKGFLKYLDFFAKHIFGYSFYDVRPIDCLKDNKIPICFMHGNADDFISYTQSENMSRQTAGYSEIHLFNGADHAQSLEKDTKRYYKIVKAFLNKILNGTF